MSATRRSHSPHELKTALMDQQYIATDEIGIIMHLSHELGKPLLTEKRACVGKTELTKAKRLPR